jgi:predicted component of type VI protein secretion system
MPDLFDRMLKLAATGEKIATLASNLGKVQATVEDHEKRLIRLETIVEITRQDGATLRIRPGSTPP